MSDLVWLKVLIALFGCVFWFDGGLRVRIALLGLFFIGASF